MLRCEQLFNNIFGPKKTKKYNCTTLAYEYDDDMKRS